jgi:hypothetical protein
MEHGMKGLQGPRASLKGDVEIIGTKYRFYITYISGDVKYTHIYAPNLRVLYTPLQNTRCFSFFRQVCI